MRDAAEGYVQLHSKIESYYIGTPAMQNIKY